MKKILIYTLKGFRFEKESISVNWVVADAEDGFIYCKGLDGESVAVPVSAIHHITESKEVN